MLSNYEMEPDPYELGYVLVVDRHNCNVKKLTAWGATMDCEPIASFSYSQKEKKKLSEIIESSS